MKKITLEDVKKTAREFSISSCEIDNCWLCGNDHAQQLTYKVVPSRVIKKGKKIIADYWIGYYRHTLILDTSSGIEAWEYGY